MNCNVIQDLLPLFVDRCCSEESAQLVKSHTARCVSCKKTLEAMEQSEPELFSEPSDALPRSKGVGKIHIAMASMLQAFLQFMGFAALVTAVALEAATPSGPDNGFWCIFLLAPFTAFLLSQANWYFLRLYRSRRAFAIGSGVLCLAFLIPGEIFALLNYSKVVFGWNLPAAVALTLLLSGLQIAASLSYAKLLGKE